MIDVGDSDLHWRYHPWQMVLDCIQKQADQASKQHSIASASAPASGLLPSVPTQERFIMDCKLKSKINPILSNLFKPWYLP